MTNGREGVEFWYPRRTRLQGKYLTKLAEDYDFDGLEIDFSRGPLLTPAGHQWENREQITEFVRRVRAMTLQVEERRRRPFLLATRVSDNLVGCHFDGLDVENWVGQQLVDILVLGVRSYELDIEGFRQVIGGRPIKLVCTLDDHHCTDGYSWPPIDVWRGTAANWWQQGMDAIQTFNWGTAPAEVAERLHLKVHGAYFDGSRQIPLYQRAYHELGSPETLKHKDKTFVVQRRGGGGSGGPPVDDWSTPRFSYQNTNMLARLPAPLDNAGKVDTLLTVYVADDVAAEAKRIEQIALRVLLSDLATEGMPRDKTIERTMITSFWGKDRYSPIRLRKASRIASR